ncbi:unnamed protein product [Caenorhabditis brenneri]
MRKMKEILLFLLYGFLMTPANSCSTVFIPWSSLDSGTFNCAEGLLCLQFIRAHPSLYTKLTLSTQDNKVKVWLVPFSHQSDTLVKASDHQKFSNVTYTADPQVGYMLELEKPSCDNNTYVKFIIERTELNSGVCRPFQQTIGHEVTIINPYKYATENISCSYQLYPGHENETLHLLSPKNFTIYTENTYFFYTPRTSKLHVVKDFQTTFFYVNYSPEGRSADDRYSQEIIGVTTNQSCVCENEETTIALFERITLQSPGYPNFLCPNTTCTKSITISQPNNSEIPEKYVERILIAFNAQSHSGVSLSIKTNDSEIMLNEDSYRNLSTALLLQPSDLTIRYNTEFYLCTDHKGHFQLNMSLILVHEECVCSMYSTDGYTSEFQLRVEVPAHCSLMSCYWRIEGELKTPGELKIQMENGGEKDFIHIWNRSIMKVYKSNELNETRSLLIEETKSETHLVFWRTGKGGNTTVLVSWEPKVESPEQNDSKNSYAKRVSNNPVDGSDVIQEKSDQE